MARVLSRLAGFAPALAVLVAAGTVLVAPVSRSGCAPVYSSLTASQASLPAEQPPARDAGERSSEDAALNAAQSMLDDLDDEAAAAAELESAAEAAEEAVAEAPDGSYTDPDFDVEMASWDVESARSSVQGAEDWLAIEEEWLADGYGDQQSVDQARADLASARDELAEAETALADAEGSAAEIDDLEQAASKARDGADRAAEDLAEPTAAAEEAMATAEAQQADNEAAHEELVRAWTRDRMDQQQLVAARNAVTSDCEAEATRTALVAAGMITVALGLAIYTSPATRRSAIRG